MAVAKKATGSKRAPKKEIKIGVIGAATASAKSVKSLLGDFIPAQQKKGNVSFVLPVTAELFSAGVKAVADVLHDMEIPYDVVTTEKAKRSRTLKPYINNAANEHVGERGLPQKIITLIGKGDSAILLALYDEDDGDLEKALEKAFAADIPVQDLAQGLGELSADEEEEESEDEEEESDEEDDSEDDEEEDEDDEAPAKKSSSKKAPAKKAAAKSKSKDDDEDDEEEEDDDSDEEDDPDVEDGGDEMSLGDILTRIGEVLIAAAKKL